MKITPASISSQPELSVAAIADQFLRRERILARIVAQIEIDPDTGCWIWQGTTSGNGRGGGYPRMTYDGQTVAVHRVIATHKKNQRRRDQARATT